MSHREQATFVGFCVAVNAGRIRGRDVLEVGSYDVNGSIRGVFDQAPPGRYVGVDLVQGPGVDVVGYGHQLDYPDGAFDVTVSAECFEHDPHWSDTFRNMVRMTRPGGLVVFTCATLGRVEHGTPRTSQADSPGTGDYYRNLTAADFAALDLGSMFAEWAFHGCRSTFDLYFAGITRGPAGMLLPDPDGVATLSTMLPLPHRLARMPLRVMHRLARDEERYQSWAVPYWNALRSRSGR